MKTLGGKCKAVRVGKRYLSPDELAIKLGISRSRVYVLAQTGEIRSIKLGRRTLKFDPTDVEAYMEAHKRGKSA